MAAPCQVCAHLHRAEIDARLVQHRCNVTALSREYGVHLKALRRHRDKHVSTFMKVYGASASLPTLGELHAEYVRLYSHALDNLASAEAGVLAGVDKDGNALVRVSPTSIARAISEARKTMDRITSLAADAADENERPAGMPDGELSERMQAALADVMARSIGGTTIPINSSNESIDNGINASIDDATIMSQAANSDHQHTPGAECVVAPPPAPTSFSLDAGIAPKSAPGLTSRAREVIEADAATKSPHNPPRHEDSPLLTTPNPNYPGSPSSSSEERAAAGYPDIVITMDDLKSNASIVAEMVQRHRRDAEQANPAPAEDML